MDFSQEVKARVCSEFEIEKIIGISDDGKYQVQWAPAWVSKNRLVGCDHLIQEFLKQESERTESHLLVPHSDDMEDGDPDLQDYALDQPDVIIKVESEMDFKAQYLTLAIQNEEEQTEVAQSELNDPGPLEACTAKIEESNIESLQDAPETSEYPGTVNINNTLIPYDTNCNELQSSAISNNQTPEENTTTVKRTNTIRHNEFHHRYMTNNIEDKQHTCPHCNKEFNNKGNLTRHIRGVHTKEKPHRCSECDYSSIDKCHLKRHMLTHTGEKTFSCSYCDSWFARKDDLKKHLRIHKKSFVCCQCGKTFARSSSLDKHMLTHVGE